MWLNEKLLNESAIFTYRSLLLNTCPNHVVIDGLFDENKLDEVLKVLSQATNWQTQKHTYASLYVDNAEWEKTSYEQRFVKRDVLPRAALSANSLNGNKQNLKIAHDFLAFLRSDKFMSLLSRIFNVRLTDIHVADPNINTNYFRLSPNDFVEQHADDSPGREVCMLLYLNKNWRCNTGGELVFSGDDKPISIAPLYNRCVLFDPSSKGSEHWVKRLNKEYTDKFRYNITSWYWSE